MNEIEVGHYWDRNAEVWTNLVRAGYDIYRDHLNTPAFFEILPVIDGLKGLEIGCGEGYNTRLLAKNGAKIDAIDISPRFIASAKSLERESPLGINYAVACASELPFLDETFSFATSFMCLMDIPNPERALTEAYRVLKHGGFFQFSIEHPCFKTRHLQKLKDEFGLTYAFEVGGYFSDDECKIEEWIFGAAPDHLKNQLSKFQIPNFHRTLSFWINSILKCGFKIEEIHEPRPSDDLVKLQPSMQGAQVISYFLQVRCRK